NTSSPGYTEFRYGVAPSFMKQGQQMYSVDGKTFGDETFYQYFNYLSLRSKTDYTAEQLDSYVKSIKPDSPLIGLGKKFKEVESKYNVNRLDPARDVIRSVESREGNRVVLQPMHTIVRKKGSITIDNELYGRYAGEMQVAINDLSKLEDLSALSKCTQLNTFYMGGGINTAMKVQTLKPLAELQQLQKLTLMNLKVKDDLLEPLMQLKNLKELSLSNQFKVEEFCILFH
ncbi:phospho-sugar glycosidase domain-containing protein, partial [Bacillus sp. SS-TM]